MKPAVRIALFLFVVALVVFGLRIRSAYGLERRVADYRSALQERGLAAERGMSSVPTEATLERRAAELAAEYQLEPSAIETHVERGAAPIGAGRLVAERMGEVAGTRDVDAGGELTTAPAGRLTTTVLEIRVHVHGRGFLCAKDEDLIVRRNLGFEMR